MKFVLKPSLEHMALVKIGISLWNQKDVSDLISKLGCMDLYLSQWEKIEEKVTEKVPQLSIPQLLKEKVFGVIKPIGIQILKWMQYYRQFDNWIEFEYDVDLDLPAHISAELCWTPQGTVDRKRTAELLVRNENLNVSRRYRLACDYFLEDDIIRFWNRLPEHVKDYDWSDFAVVSFWSDKIKRGGAGHISYKHVFYSSAGDSNKIAAKYFLQKLTPEEREESLKRLVLYVKDADVLCFLLPEMEEEEQKKVFKSYPHYVLECFLQWPWQSFYIGIATCMWDFLSKDIYDKILRDILRKVEDSYKDYNYQKFFREFWQISPGVLKDLLVEEIHRSSLLLCLINIKDKEIVRLIFKDATLTAKEKLIYSTRIICYLKRSIRKNEWDFLQFFIRECLPSKNKMLKFKVEFEKSVRHSYIKEHFAAKKQEWDRLYHFSDDSIGEYVKRSVEEGESSSSKRFQSLHSNTCLKKGKKLF